MSSAYNRLLSARPFAADGAQPAYEALDVGNYRVLEVDFNVIKAGTAGELRLQHSATNVDEAFRDLASASVLLNSATSSFIEVTKFLRFVRWKVDSSVAGTPIAQIDIIAKS